MWATFAIAAGLLGIVLITAGMCGLVGALAAGSDPMARRIHDERFILGCFFVVLGACILAAEFIVSPHLRARKAKYVDRNELMGGADLQDEVSVRDSRCARRPVCPGDSDVGGVR